MFVFGYTFYIFCDTMSLALRLRSRMRQQSRFASGPLFSDLLCCRVPLVLLRFAVFGKSVFVTFIRKGQKMGKNGELEISVFYEFRADTRAFSQGH